jgi:1,4-alpha-glucan branching enzyme
MFLDEYHVDGFRFDEVTVIDRHDGGWRFCQDLTATLRFHKPAATLIAEYWGEQRWLALWSPPDGMGFHLGYADLLRNRVRDLLGEVARGAEASVDMGQLRPALERPQNAAFAWQAYNCLENHDLLWDADGDHHRLPPSPSSATGTIPGPGTPAAGPAWPRGCCSPPPGSRCCSWARSSLPTGGGPTTRTGPSC